MPQVIKLVCTETEPGGQARSRLAGAGVRDLENEFLLCAGSGKI